MRKFIAGLALLGALTFAAVGFGAEVADSVGALYRRSYDNSIRFTCTVSALDWDSPDKMILLTAKHCVDRNKKYYLVSFDNVSFHNAELYMLPREDPDDPKVDMALLIMDKLDIPLLKVDLAENIPSGTDIVTVGFPLGIAKLLYKGYIAGTIHNLGSNFNNYRILQIFGAPGSSGTSVVDASTHKVLGVLVGARGGSIGTPVIYATPIHYIKYLMTPKSARKRKKHLDDEEKE